MPGLFPDLLESPGINAGRHIGSAKKGGGVLHKGPRDARVVDCSLPITRESPIISPDLESGRAVQDHPQIRSDKGRFSPSHLVYYCVQNRLTRLFSLADSECFRK